MDQTELLSSGLQEVGVPALGLTLFLAAIGLPIPSAVLVLAAGGFGRQGMIDWPAALFIGWAGVVMGDCGSYALGRLGGARLSQRFQRKRPAAWLKARTRFRRHGSMAIFLTRTVFPALDFPTSLLAGSLSFPFGQFLAIDILGRFIWISAHLLLGYTVGDQWPAIVRILKDHTLWLGGLIGIVVCLYLMRHRIPYSRHFSLVDK